LPLAAINSLGTLIAVFFTDKLGRRYIILRSTLFIAVALWILSLGLGLHNFGNLKEEDVGSWISMTGILLYMCFFSVGMGNAPWTVNSEIYPLHLRGVGLSCATTANWIANYAIASLFLTLTSTDLGQVITFAGISVFCILCFIFVYYLLPETKGKSVE
jgi:SP family myo-inositol transporter-like MFS transporter 13